MSSFLCPGAAVTCPPVHPDPDRLLYLTVLINIVFSCTGATVTCPSVHLDPDRLLYLTLAHQVIPTNFYPLPYHGENIYNSSIQSWLFNSVYT